MHELDSRVNRSTSAAQPSPIGTFDGSSSRPIIELFKGIEQMLAPLFQRSYEWGPKEWKVLWDAILEQYEHNQDAVLASISQAQLSRRPARSAGFAPGPYQRNYGPCRSGPNVSVFFVQSSDEVAGQSSQGASVKSDAKCPRCFALHFWI